MLAWPTRPSPRRLLLLPLAPQLALRPAALCLAILAVAAVIGDAVVNRARSPLIPLAFTIAVAATWGETGHAATGGPLAMASLTLHVAAMALWAGGLATVAILAVAASPSMSATAARFSRLALAAIAVPAATGLYQAWRELGAISALISTAYGRLLLLKVALLLAVLAVATRSRALVTRRAVTEAALRSSVLIELTGAAALLLPAVLLAGTAPPHP